MKTMLKKEQAGPTAAPRRARGRPRTEDLAELEARLIRVAREHFLANGYGGTSVNELARAAQVSKGTFYARFPSKADLFRAIIDEQIRDYWAKVPLLGPKPKTLEAMLHIYGEASLQESLRVEIVQLNRLIYSESGRFSELGEAAWMRTRVGVRQVSDLIREYATRENVPCRDPEAAAELFTAALRGFYGDVLQSGRAATEPEIKAWVRKMVSAFLAGRSNW